MDQAEQGGKGWRKSGKRANGRIVAPIAILEVPVWDLLALQNAIGQQGTLSSESSEQVKKASESKPSELKPIGSVFPPDSTALNATSSNRKHVPITSMFQS
jgi:hypothetical protein